MKQLILSCVLLHSLTIIAQQRYDVIIDEIMADPSPPNTLPNYEWIELKNRSNTAINLQNWRIGDASSLSGAMPSFVLQPGEFVILCSNTALASMSSFGMAIALTGFPSLDNESDRLFLRAADGSTMHAVEYNIAWYDNALKQQGGWTLEMSDTNIPCAGFTNWKASTAAAGGTPGRKNAIDTITIDTNPPRLKRSYTTDNTTIHLLFDEPLDSLNGATLSNYTIDNGIILITAIAIPPLFNEVQLKTGSPLSTDTLYNVSASVSDCNNNAGHSIIRTGLPVDPLPGDWIINEILFNPYPGGDDYVECYHHSNKIIDASRLYISNRNSNGVIGTIQPLSITPFYIFPGDHIVITENAARLALHYLVPYPDAVLVIPALPSLPDTEGTLVLLNQQGMITDELKYKDDWHFPLIANAEGVSLERIDPGGDTQDKSNWHSAASTAGYGTPGYKNSQYKQQGIINASIEIKPVLFSPDNDGIDDITCIQYRLNEPGYSANIVIFDAAGRPVRYLVRNAVPGLAGYWNWDGLGETKNRLPAGIYIIFTELFNTKGKRMRFKNAVVVVYKL